MKKTIGFTLFGIIIGSAIFAIVGICFDIKYHGNYSMSDWSYTKMVVSSMLVGIGFSVPSLVYDNEKLPQTIKILIHMGIGCVVMLAVSFSVGWIPLEAGWLVCSSTIAGYLLFAFAIRFICSFYFKREAKQINEKIQKIQKD
ncbi:MAG: DUF3021 domain-containing protein [Oscillospiraceae bacterium]